MGSRVVFLDIDGVLNNTKSAAQIILKPELVARLKTIVEEGHAQIVLTTFWRPFDDYIAYALSRVGLDGALIVGATPGYSKSTSIQHSSAGHLLHPEPFDDLKLYKTRADEIREFLRLNRQIEKFVILDDRKDAADGDLLPAFILTDPSVGLTEDHVARALTLLR